MALRDPGVPRRNPLFTVDDPAGPDPRAHAHDADTPDAGDDGWDDWADDPIFGGSDNPLFGAPGSAVGPFVTALTEAGPEAAEHLVNAAHELTLAIKVVVDAFERTLAEQRAAFAAEHPEPTGTPDVDIDLDLEDEPFARPTRRPVGEPKVAAPRVQSIDLE